MNISLIIANILTVLAFVIHTFVGDREIRILEPQETENENFQKQEKWTMARCGWHWVSFGLVYCNCHFKKVSEKLH